LGIFSSTFAVKGTDPFNAAFNAFKWLNRRGGKRKSFTWAFFGRAIEKLGIAKPRITESRCLQYELVFA
jgi:hypothetical protein